MAYLYLLRVGCYGCGEQTTFLEERDQPVPLTESVDVSAEHCPACGEDVRKHGGWDLLEDAVVERTLPPSEQGRDPKRERERGTRTDGGGRLSDEEYTAMLGWFMASDPWPAGQDDHDIIKSVLNGEASARGWDGWVEAYHEMTATDEADGQAVVDGGSDTSVTESARDVHEAGTAMGSHGVGQVDLVVTGDDWRAAVNVSVQASSVEDAAERCDGFNTAIRRAFETQPADDGGEQ